VQYEGRKSKHFLFFLSEITEIINQVGNKKNSFYSFHMAGRNVFKASGNSERKVFTAGKERRVSDL
jgi:hypothetical protein